MALERQINANDIESIVCRLRDVIAVSVVADERGDVAEIHVLTGSSRPAKQVVRDVESAIMARLGVAVDHKKISIAQVDDGPARFDHTRLKFSDVSISLNGSRTEATVRMIKDGAIYSGSASGPGSPSSQMKLIAGATLRAIEDSGLASSSIVLEDVTEAQVAGRRVAVVMVNMVTDRGEDLLTGSAIIRQDVWKGVVNATLDAVNRRLSVPNGH
ncbi:MAG: hypothetical protein M1133_10055 [Armatimonadetes bacterium]|nr:hypothetical protein [Armatimonadota bacterium]